MDKTRLQRYLPLHTSKKDYDTKAEEQPSSIWEDNYQDHSISNSDTRNSEVSTLGMPIGISDKSNNTIIEISSDPTKYKTLDVEDTTHDTAPSLPTAIDTYDQTTISSMTSNNYDYKKSK